MRLTGGLRATGDKANASSLIITESGEKYTVNLETLGGSYTGTLVCSGVKNGNSDGLFNRNTNAFPYTFVATEKIDLIRVWVSSGAVFNNYKFRLQLEKNGVATGYEKYKSEKQYVVAKDEEGHIVELRSLPNGTKDEVRDIIRITNGKAELIRKVGNKKDVPNGAVINYADMADDGVFEAWGANDEHIVGVKGDTLDFDAVKLNYQLAEPEEIPIEIEGDLMSYPNGTIYIDPYISNMYSYNNGIVLDYPVVEIDKLS